MAMETIMESLINDVELQQMRKEWIKQGKKEPFWPFNFDEFHNIDEYKQKLREELFGIEKNI